LFWKKPPPERRLFELDSDNQRRFFRVAPLSPIRLTFHGQSVMVKDIGAGGLAMANRGWRAGDRRRAAFGLPAMKDRIEVELEIVSVDAGDTCHCAFTRIDEAAIESIHLYVLRVQKEALRRRRKAEDSEPPDVRDRMAEVGKVE